MPDGNPANMMFNQAYQVGDEKKLSLFSLNFDERAQISERIIYLPLKAENRGVCNQDVPMCGSIDKDPQANMRGQVGDECVTNWHNFFQYIKITFVDDDPSFIAGSLMKVGQRVC